MVNDKYKDRKKYSEEKMSNFFRDISKNVKSIEKKVVDGKKVLNFAGDISDKLSHLITEVRDLYWVLGSRNGNGNGYYKKSKDYGYNNGNGY